MYLQGAALVLGLLLGNTLRVRPILFKFKTKYTLRRSPALGQRFEVVFLTVSLSPMTGPAQIGLAWGMFPGGISYVQCIILGAV